jgi:lipopolysaccharide transport system ATP-binding protein
LNARFDSIARFADIGAFIDQPVKTYSSGMYVRLAFAVIANVDADLLVIDEALAVGDAVFTQKCMRFLRRFQEHGTILFVSHNTGAVLNLCSRAMWLHEGILMQIGAAKQVVEAYMRANAEASQRLERTDTEIARPSTSALPAEQGATNDQPPGTATSALARGPFDSTNISFGAGGASISSVEMLAHNGGLIRTARGGERVTLRITVTALQEINSAIVGFHFKDSLGQILFAENTYEATATRPVVLSEGDTAVAEFSMEIPHLKTGEYSLDIAVAEGTQHEHVQHQWFFDVLIIHVLTDRAVFGLFAVPHTKISLIRPTTQV